jgi:hypothetical protein
MRGILGLGSNSRSTKICIVKTPLPFPHSLTYEFHLKIHVTISQSCGRTVKSIGIKAADETEDKVGANLDGAPHLAQSRLGTKIRP